MGKYRLSCLVCVLLLVGCHAAEEQTNAGAANDDKPVSSEEFVDYTTPQVDDGQYFYEHFDDEQSFASKWIKSSASKADSSELKYDGEWSRVATQAQLKGKFRKVMLHFLWYRLAPRYSLQWNH